jgi:hypothetical protein
MKKNDFGSSKTKLTRANAPNIIFVEEIWEKKLNIINAEIWENNAEI